MKTHGLIGLCALALLGACADDSTSDSTTDETTATTGAETGTTSGDGDGDPATGDGDGDPTGDGDGDPTGDGDGDPTGDGDGDPTGDGDGDMTGDGDGDGDMTGDGDGDMTGDGDGDMTGDGDGDPAPDCEPQQAVGQGPCDQFFGYAWNGASCVAVNGCNCVGPDCDALALELDACEANYADCEPAPPPGCANLDLTQCEDAPECQPINGAPLTQLDDDSYCAEQQQFIACDDPRICVFVFTWACSPDNSAVLFSSSCIPDGWAPCNPPADIIPECG